MVTSRADAGRLSFAVALVCFVGLVMTVIWAAGGQGYYWPSWIWLAGFVAVVPFACWMHVAGRGGDGAFFLHADVTGAACVVLTLIWLFSGAQGAWVVWPVAALLVPLALHALIRYRDQLPFAGRHELEERVQTLTRTRRGAVDAEAAELRRIERDLHDGAQARLVALSMQLGRAEARLGDHPAAAALVKAAREEAGAAIAELRDLARGIAPPVLADRGLAAAVRSLADRSAITVDVTDDLGEQSGRRLPPAVENAAYFVVAETLTNVAKHAPTASARVGMTREDGCLLVDVIDDGQGGADPSGAGLRGLKARVEALDGRLAVISPVGGPTVVRAELPCGS